MFSLSEHMEWERRIGELNRLIEAKRGPLTEAFPEILDIHAASPQEEDGSCSYKVYVLASGITPELQAALEEAFQKEALIVDKTDRPPACWPLMKMLFRRDDDGLNGLDCGYTLSVESDAEGGYFDMKLNQDTEENRKIASAAYPGARMKFSRNDNPMTITFVRDGGLEP